MISGELNSIRLGLFAFAVQTAVLAISTSHEVIFISLLLSLLSNLVYPAISSLVSRNVDTDNQGEALGALNGIKALTEGVGPLAFGGLMAVYEDAEIPGAPYMLATALVLWSFLHTYELPKQPDLVRARFLGEASAAEDTTHLLLSQESDERNL